MQYHPYMSWSTLQSDHNTMHSMFILLYTCTKSICRRTKKDPVLKAETHQHNTIKKGCKLSSVQEIKLNIYRRL